MTRITDFGRKRTFVQAGFVDTPEPGSLDSVPNGDADHTSAQPPAKKKRKRTPKSKRDGHGTLKAQINDEKAENAVEKQETNVSTKTSQEKKKARADKFKRLTGSEARRQKRIQERQANTTCFACRETGHAAKYCPTAKANGSKSVGICYRCGSTRHSLSKCAKPEDPENPLPHALCFVCSQKGHLASTCPENKAKGLYPNGGCCKLCRENTHLAKDCKLRKEESNVPQVLLVGTGKEVGPDEDDFHSLKRVRKELDREDRKDAAHRRATDVKVGAFTGVVKAFRPKAAVKKKVVTF